MKVTLIGHSTVLIETAGQRLLTDPYFGTGGNPAYARLRPPALPREALRDVDLVLVSHNHWDHVDSPFFRSLPGSVPVVAPARAVWLTRLQGAKTVIGLRKWECRAFGAVSVTAVPAVHSALAAGYVIVSEGRQVYFAGDTYHRPFMRELGCAFDLDLALLPVTTYRIPMTMGEAEAVRATQDLEPDVIIPIHLGIQPRSPLLRTDQSPEGFERRVREAGLPCRVVHLREGESWQPG